jgi:hypothetical protein
MKHEWIKKGFVLGIVMLFLGAGVTTCFAQEGKENILNSVSDGEGTLFSDNFDDNTKNFSKWTEIYTDGTWEEINQRAEFQCYESGDGSNRYEGIESSAFTVSLSPTESVNINWDVITKIAGTISSVGQPKVSVTDGTHWIEASYDRWNDKTKYRDSTYPPGEIWTILETGKGDGSWSNEIEIFSDRYYVTMDSVGSGPVYHTIFSSNPTLKVQIFIAIGGSNSLLYLRSGFDNVIVQGSDLDNQPPYAPSNPVPSDGEPNVDINTDLSWMGGDPDGDPVTYDVFLGINNPPTEKVSANQTATTYDPGTLDSMTTYYWNIVAWDNHHASTAGPLWTFSTMQHYPPYQPRFTNNPTWWLPGVEYELRLYATDPEGNNVYYYIDWGDGTNSEWTIDQYPSGEEVQFFHTYRTEGLVTIKAKAKNIYNAESNWSKALTLKVKDPGDQLTQVVIIGVFSDLRSCGDYYWCKSAFSVYGDFNPTKLKFLTPGTEMVISKQYTIGVIVELRRAYIVAGIFDGILVSEIEV